MARSLDLNEYCIKAGTQSADYVVSQVYGCPADATLTAELFQHLRDKLIAAAVGALEERGYGHAADEASERIARAFAERVALL